MAGLFLSSLLTPEKTAACSSRWVFNFRSAVISRKSRFLNCVKKRPVFTRTQVVFLDELTTGLDAKARRDVWKILKELKDSGLTIFLTSHFMDEVEALCDEICILQKGRAVFYGTVAHAKEKSGCENFEDAYLKLSGEEME